MLVNVASDRLSVFMELLSPLFLRDYWRPKKFWNSSINIFLVFRPVEVMFITYKKKFIGDIKSLLIETTTYFVLRYPTGLRSLHWSSSAVYLFRAV